jgi:H+/Cl- antiporter ClcA
MHATRGRAGSILALVLAAVVGGAFAGLVTAAFIWSFETLIELVWSDLPAELGVDPFESWYLFVVPAIGGVLVGLGHRFLGDYPEPMETTIARWKAGGRIEPTTVPASALNSLSALAAGGPVGFEAALLGVIGGIATWIGGNIRGAAETVRQAWGADRVDAVSRTQRTLPVWLAAVAGLFTYRWLPFGELDLGFRFDDLTTDLRPADGLVIVLFAMVVTVPAAWAMAVVVAAERGRLYQRSPVVAGVVGGLGFASMALVSQYVLFSGQDATKHLIGLGNGELWYLTFAKWLALVIALAAGWRGGPIFPMFTAVSALAVVVDGWLDIEPHLLMAGGMAAVAAVLLRGSIPMVFVLMLYAVPFSYAGVVLAGAAGASVMFAVAHLLGILPTPRAAETASPTSAVPMEAA